MTLPIADVSQWQGAINYPLLVYKTDGVIIRAGTGVQEDLRFQANYAGLMLHPGELGAYWFVWSHINGAHQAEAFDAVLGNRKFDFLVMDAEENGAGLSQSALRARYKLFIDTLQALRPDADIVIYTRASFWDPNIGVAGWEKYYKLWVAHYGVEYPTIPTAWDGIFWLHQYSADGNNLGAEYGVSSDDIDLNRLNPALEPPPDPDPEPVPPPLPLPCVPRSATIKQDAWLRTRGVVTLTYPPAGTRIVVLKGGTPVQVLPVAVPPSGGYDWLLLYVPSLGLYGVTAAHLVSVSA